MGLALALAEMQAQRPDRRVVVIPSYCCPSVPVVVRSFGLTARPAPVGENLNLDLDALPQFLDRGVLAVVGVHMYALPLDTNRLNVLANAVGAFVVDDAAHVVGVADRSRPLGTDGDVGMLSFNQSKTLTGGSPNGGGALLVMNKTLEAGIAKRYEALAEGRNRLRSYALFALRYGIEVTPRALSTYLGPLEQPLLAALGEGARIDEKMCASAARAVMAQMRRLPGILAGRRRVVAHYADALKSDPNLSFVQSDRPQYLSRMMVKWKEGPPAADVREAMARRGFATRVPYRVWSDDEDALSVSVRTIGATHLELPGAPTLTAAQVEATVAALRDCLARRDGRA
jgi:dTDP-4-amino-4,6-dideoxygalactose transaminase